MKYFKITQILKTKGTDQIVDEAKGYAMGESIKSFQEHEDLRKEVDIIYQLYDVENIYEECSKEEYDEYSDKHISFEDLNNKIVNWKIISFTPRSTELVPDFLKEQDCIRGREYLVKADIHVKRFFENIYKKKLSDKKVYEFLLQIYNDADFNTKRDVPPYKVDKLIYLIGEHLGNPDEAKKFADWVFSECQD